MKKIITILVLLQSSIAWGQAGFEWGTHYASDEKARVEDAAMDSKGNVYTVGSHQLTVKPNCNGTSTSKTNTDSDWADFIQQVKPDGTLGYIKGLGGTDYSFANSLGVDKNDNSTDNAANNSGRFLFFRNNIND
mgnify:CR=1 FL=1